MGAFGGGIKTTCIQTKKILYTWKVMYFKSLNGCGFGSFLNITRFFGVFN